MIPNGRGLGQLEAMHQGVTVIDIDRVVSGDLRPTRNARHNRRVSPHLGSGLDAALEGRPDDAFVDKFPADGQATFGDKLGHSR